MADRKLKKGKSLYLMMIFLLSLIASHRVTGAPQPMPGMMYGEDYDMEAPSQILINRLKQIVERKEEKIEKEIDELAEEQMEFQALIEAKVRSEKVNQQQRQEFSGEDNESLPAPAAVYHTRPINPGKRTSYMALCHFKICNMGRKRQM